MTCGGGRLAECVVTYDGSDQIREDNVKKHNREEFIEIERNFWEVHFVYNITPTKIGI